MRTILDIGVGIVIGAYWPEIKLAVGKLRKKIKESL